MVQEIGGRVNASRTFHALTDAAQKSLLSALGTTLQAMKVEPLCEHGGYMEGTVYAQTKLKLYIMRIINDYERLFSIASSVILEHSTMDLGLRSAWAEDMNRYLVALITEWCLNDGIQLSADAMFKEFPDREAVEVQRRQRPTDAPLEDVPLQRPQIPQAARHMGSLAGWLIRGETSGHVALSQAVDGLPPAPVTPPPTLESALARALEVWVKAPGTFVLMEQIIHRSFHGAIMLLTNAFVGQFHEVPPKPDNHSEHQAQRAKSPPSTQA